MRKRIEKATDGTEVVFFIPENDADNAKLTTLVNSGKVSDKQSFGDWKTDKHPYKVEVVKP
jgi:hypothetical protein